MDAEKPIFIIGTGRCGSTIVFETLSVHEDLGWLSNYNKLFPRIGMASVAPRLYSLPGLRKIGRGEKRQYGQGTSFWNKLLPMPMECYAKWNVLVGKKFSFDFLKDQSATEEEVRRVHKAVRQVLFWQGKRRFAAKYTGPTRMTFIQSIFPDARFIHTRRDHRAVIYSLLDVDYWTDQKGQKRPRWSGGLADGWEEEWQQYGQTPLALAAMQYRAIMQICKQEQEHIGKNVYMEVWYEDFVKAPHRVMQQILSFCNLPDSTQVDAFLDGHKYVNMNLKYLERMTPREADLIERIIGPL